MMPPVPIERKPFVVAPASSMMVVPVLLKVMPSIEVVVPSAKLTVVEPFTDDWLKTTESVEMGTTPVVPPDVAVVDQFDPTPHDPVVRVSQ